MNHYLTKVAKDVKKGSCNYPFKYNSTSRYNVSRWCHGRTLFPILFTRTKRDRLITCQLAERDKEFRSVNYGTPVQEG